MEIYKKILLSTMSSQSLKGPFVYDTKCGHCGLWIGILELCSFLLSSLTQELPCYIQGHPLERWALLEVTNLPKKHLATEPVCLLYLLCILCGWSVLWNFYGRSLLETRNSSLEGAHFSTYGDPTIAGIAGVNLFLIIMSALNAVTKLLWDNGGMHCQFDCMEDK